MTRPPPLRRLLLAAVDAFLEATPASVAKACRLIARCETLLGTRVPAIFTLDAVVWGGMVTELSDSVYYEHLPTLRTYRALLADGSPTLHRLYLNHDFGPYFTPVECAWHTSLQRALDVVTPFPVDAPASAAAQYTRLKRRIARLAEQSPPPARFGDETIYHFILRQVTTIVTTVRLDRPSFQPEGVWLDGEYRLIPPPGWTFRTVPDVRESLTWAQNALRSIVAAQWLLITWQVTPEGYQLSLL